MPSQTSDRIDYPHALIHVWAWSACVNGEPESAARLKGFCMIAHSFSHWLYTLTSVGSKVYANLTLYANLMWYTKTTNHILRFSKSAKVLKTSQIWTKFCLHESESEMSLSLVPAALCLLVILWNNLHWNYWMIKIQAPLFLSKYILDSVFFEDALKTVKKVKFNSATDQQTTATHILSGVCSN